MTATGSAVRSPARPGEPTLTPTPRSPGAVAGPRAGDPGRVEGMGSWPLFPVLKPQSLVASHPSLGCPWSLMFGFLCGHRPQVFSRYPGVRVAGAKGSGGRPRLGALGTYPLGLDLNLMPESPASPTLMPPVSHRWWAGEWQLCSSSCGPGGLSRRAVLCIRSIGLDEQSALEPSACEHLPRPPAETPCNREVACPATWAMGNWSQVSIRMGDARTQLHHRSRAAGRQRQPSVSPDCQAP